MNKAFFSFMLLVCTVVNVFAQKQFPVPVEKNSKFGYVNSNGDLVIDTAYIFADYFEEGLALVEKDKQKSYLDVNGRVVLGPLYLNSASAFSDGWAKLTDTLGMRYYINHAGEKMLDVPLDLYDAQNFPQRTGSSKYPGTTSDW
jgi:hypothetical protein